MSAAVLLERLPKIRSEIGDVIGDEAALDLERRLVLQAIDQCWADHLAVVAEIRDGIHLVTIGGMSPLEEFQQAVARSFTTTW